MILFHNGAALRGGCFEDTRLCKDEGGVEGVAQLSVFDGSDGRRTAPEHSCVARETGWFSR